MTVELRVHNSLWPLPVNDRVYLRAHYLRRLNYCSVYSFTGSEGGEDNNRKVEIIRDGTVYQSLAYACPFCAAGYLRPDSLAQ